MQSCYMTTRYMVSSTSTGLPWPECVPGIVTKTYYSASRPFLCSVSRRRQARCRRRRLLTELRRRLGLGNRCVHDGILKAWGDEAYRLVPKSYSLPSIKRRRSLRKMAKRQTRSQRLSPTMRPTLMLQMQARKTNLEKSLPPPRKAPVAIPMTARQNRA